MHAWTRADGSRVRWSGGETAGAASQGLFPLRQAPDAGLRGSARARPTRGGTRGDADEEDARRRADEM
eukprot:scaffold1505_cov390-Prasinococcus_capsulatus_cf.AAC.4